MDEFEYTRGYFPDSSVVEGIYYNEDTKELAVDLDDRVYRYENVPVDEFEHFKEVPSTGRHYGSYFKRTYGPANYVGLYDDIDFVSVSPNPVEMPVSPNRAQAPNRPDNDYYAQPQRLMPGHDGWGSVETVGTPKDLKVTEDTVITNVTNTYALTAPEATVRKHAVTFTTNDVEKTHTLKANSVDEAVNELHEIAAMLGLAFSIKSVTVYFE